MFLWKPGFFVEYIKEQHLLKLTFDQFNGSLLNKNIHLFQPLNGSVYKYIWKRKNSECAQLCMTLMLQK